MKNGLTLAACCLCLSSCTTTPMAPAMAAGPSATAVMRPASGSQAHGSVKLTQMGDRVKVEGEIAGLEPGRHGFHIHDKGDCSAPDAASAGAHFNPGGKKHGVMVGDGPHAGDMPNLHIPADGSLVVEVLNAAVTLEKDKPNSLFKPEGTALVIHAGKDDYKTDPTGDAGGRIACGVVE